MQADAPRPHPDRTAEAGAALQDLSRLQSAPVRVARLPAHGLEHLAMRAEALTRDGSAIAVAIALRLRVEPARQGPRP